MILSKYLRGKINQYIFSRPVCAFFVQHTQASARVTKSYIVAYADAAAEEEKENSFNVFISPCVGRHDDAEGRKSAEILSLCVSFEIRNYYTITNKRIEVEKGQTFLIFIVRVILIC